MKPPAATGVLTPFLCAGQTHLFEVGPNATVADVKELVQAREGECRKQPVAQTAASSDARAAQRRFSWAAKPKPSHLAGRAWYCCSRCCLYKGGAMGLCDGGITAEQQQHEGQQQQRSCQHPCVLSMMVVSNSIAVLAI